MKGAEKYTPDPHRARLARTQKRRESLQPVAEALSMALDKAVDLLNSPEDDVKLRAIHAVTQCANTYARMYEVGELEYRLAMLELSTQNRAGNPSTADIEQLVATALDGPDP